MLHIARMIERRAGGRPYRAAPPTLLVFAAAILTGLPLLASR